MGKDANVKNVNVRFPPHVLDSIKDVADREGRSQNAAICWAVVDYLRERGYDIDLVEVGKALNIVPADGESFEKGEMEVGEE